MKKIFRRKRTWLVILIVVIVAPVTYGFWMMSEFEWNEREINEYFKNRSMVPQYNTYEVNSRTVYYASIGSDTLPMVLFVHGAPGSWTDYIKYFGDSLLVSQVRLVAPDRPGYGKSGEGNYLTSIDSQARMIMPLLDLNKSNQPVVVVGHSYGGPIAARIAMLMPDKVKGLLLLAPAIDPDHEKQFAINKLASWKLIQELMPKMWLSAYYEKRTHVDELRKIDSDWYKIVAPTVYMFGDKDNIVPPINAEYAKYKMTKGTMEVIEFPNGNHFIPWNEQDTVTREILRLAQ